MLEGGEPEVKVDNADAPGEATKDVKAPTATVSKTTGVILAFAMGFHAFFEGIAFGLLTEVNLAL